MKLFQPDVVKIKAFKLFIFKKLLYPLRMLLFNLKANVLYFRSIIFKKCYYGPFTGEFGHLLGHNLPFISYLYSKGVKVDFCGMDIYKPFFVDEMLFFPLSIFTKFFVLKENTASNFVVPVFTK